MQPKQYRNRGKSGFCGGPNARACKTSTIATFSNWKPSGPPQLLSIIKHLKPPADAIPPVWAVFPRFAALLRRGGGIVPPHLFASKYGRLWRFWRVSPVFRYFRICGGRLFRACFPRVGPCCSICGRFLLRRWNCTNAGRSCEIRPFPAILRYFSGRPPDLNGGNWPNFGPWWLFSCSIFPEFWQ